MVRISHPLHSLLTLLLLLCNKCTIEVTECIVNKKLASNNVNKSKDLDNIHLWLLKHPKDIQAAPFAVIFIKSIKAAQLLVNRKKAYITPISKKGKRNSAANYMPISISLPLLLSK